MLFSVFLDIQNNNTIVAVYKRPAMQLLCRFQLKVHVVIVHAAIAASLNC
jgi:hypothetical protein